MPGMASQRDPIPLPGKFRILLLNTVRADKGNCNGRVSGQVLVSCQKGSELGVYNYHYC